MIPLSVLLHFQNSDTADEEAFVSLEISGRQACSYACLPDIFSDTNAFSLKLIHERNANILSIRPMRFTLDVDKLLIEI